MRSELEVADIFRRHDHAYRVAHDGHLGRVERRVMSAIELCRTAALGGHVEACEDCAHARVCYNSCRNRHCPKCQSATRERWLADRQADLLPVPYFHVVFTVPAEVTEIAFHNKAVVYAILFDAVAATLKTIAADPRHLGGEIGFLAILHTWGQALTHHPHIHCLVPGGALSPDGRWLSCRPRFFLPIHVLSRLFRRLFLERLQAAYAAGRLRFSGTLDGLGQAHAFAAAIRQLRRKNWIVYAKPPFGSPEQVLAYLGRYTHRVAIANSRLVSADETSVTFRWRDYRHGNAPRLMSLDPHEFIRRFLLHCLPDGFHRIRHYGFLANGCRRTRLAIIRQLLVAMKLAPTAAAGETTRPLPRFDPTVCPCCGGILRITATLPRWRTGPSRPQPDTS
ncbi:IS91 family transposase [Mesorhizobium sp. L-8-3]|uniref:IS91 family transposase n=1 Tax=Mesorhizobium sp. L-8-3 TaxID=2744522 RepID=UPI001926849C|nr:IS91 family transposase [Mesorhizobium sp. L-8-3]BCH27020.1 IS91 family transposase [Mesorhizobium sp. L-8-3]